MKIDVITRHSVPNYGSLLQSYATQKAIEKLGHESEIINYTRYEERYENLANTLIKGKKWEKNIILRCIYKVIQTPNYTRQYKKFAEYRKNFLKETCNEYGNIDELKNNLPLADIYCSGSDQIWGKIGSSEYDEAYFLEFARDKKCISYASSFGKTELNNSLINKLRNMLSKYSSILVREDSAKELLKDQKFENVEQVLDPTLLLDKEEWSKLANKSCKKLPKNYVLVYQLHDNKKFDKYAKKFAKEKRMKLLRVSPSIFHITRSGKLVYLPNQYDFLNLFKNANYVLTDSFHATVFSIIFNRNFIDILPENNTGTRIESILRLFKINNKILNSFEDFNSIDYEIEWNSVNKIMKSEREKSVELLKEAIEK